MPIDEYKQIRHGLWIKNTNAAASFDDRTLCRQVFGIKKFGSFVSSTHWLVIHWDTETNTGKLSCYLNDGDASVTWVNDVVVNDAKKLEGMWNRLGDLYWDSCILCRGKILNKYMSPAQPMADVNAKKPAKKGLFGFW